MRDPGRMPVACVLHALRPCIFPVTYDPSRAVTLPNIGVPHHNGVSQRVTYSHDSFRHRQVCEDRARPVDGPASGGKGSKGTSQGAGLRARMQWG